MKPELFIGSSYESIDVVNALEQKLKFKFHVKPWTKGIFDISSTTLEDLLEQLNKSEFGIFVFTPDDISKIRKKTHLVARDNVLFELGLYFGKLGRKNSFILVPSKIPGNFHLPTDLIGINLGKFSKKINSSYENAVTPFCKQLKKQIFKHEKFNLSGKWNLRWMVKSSDYSLKTHNSDIFHYGNRMISQYFNKRDSYIYKFRGEIDGHYVTGTWENTAGGPTYHGAFQVRISANKEELIGTWIGWSRNGTIKSGQCVWRKKK